MIMMRKVRWGLTGCLLALGLVACSGGGTGGAGGATGSGGATSSGGTTTTSAGGGGAASACNTVAITAPAITDANGAGTKPVPEGGTIADGTYEVTAHTYYAPGSAKGTTYQVMLVVAGSTAQIAQIRDSGAEERFSLSVSTTGTTFSGISSCPVTGTALDFNAYTATATELLLFNPTNGSVVTFTKQ